MYNEQVIAVGLHLAYLKILHHTKTAINSMCVTLTYMYITLAPIDAA